MTEPVVNERPLSEQPLSEAEAAVWAPAARALVVALAARGLVASVHGHGAVLARNPAGEPAPDDLVGAALSPGLNQEVWCRPDWPGRELWWFWAWSGPNRNDPPELEPLCPASETVLAADAIARVLAVPFADVRVS